MEPLDDKADECNDTVYPEDDADQDPVDNTDEQFEAVRVLFEREKLPL
jgi:hypothetical protein